VFFKKARYLKRYPIENGKAVIEMVVSNFNELFDERDPSPFRLKDLHDEVVEYIVASAKELPLRRIGKIKIFFQNEKSLEGVQELTTAAIHSYFQYETEIMSKKIREVLSNGVKSLLIGTVFLTTSVLVSSSVHSSNESFWNIFMKEGLILLGWVSMWKPIDVFLYEWWPLVEVKKIYSILSEIDVDIELLK